LVLSVLTDEIEAATGAPVPLGVDAVKVVVEEAGVAGVRHHLLDEPIDPEGRSGRGDRSGWRLRECLWFDFTEKAQRGETDNNALSQARLPMNVVPRRFEKLCEEGLPPWCASAGNASVLRFAAGPPHRLPAGWSLLTIPTDFDIVRTTASWRGEIQAREG